MEHTLFYVMHFDIYKYIDYYKLMSVTETRGQQANGITIDAFKAEKRKKIVSLESFEYIA